MLTPASTNLISRVGDDFSLVITVTEGGSAYDFDGYAALFRVYNRIGATLLDKTTVSDAASVSLTSGTITVTLAKEDAEYAALPAGTYRWEIALTYPDATLQTWIVGDFVHQPRRGAPSEQSNTAGLEVTSTSVELTVFSPASVIPLAQKGTAGGVASLDGQARVPGGQIPASLSRHGEYASRLFQLRATGESRSLAADFDYTHLNTQESLISGNTSKLHAWAFGLPGPAWVDLDLPFGVVIGDSIAEGHPGLHGRLHPGGSGGYDAGYANQSGQTSYELGRITGMYWYNHGIGSQTSTQVLARWNRDVLAMTDDPGDGRGSSTLPRQPYVVYVHVGVNDVALDVPASTIKANLLAMAKSAHEAGILAIFDNIGPFNAATTAQQAVIDEVNAWMPEALGAYGAVVVDYNAWANDGSGDNRTDLIGDGIHPTQGGYKALARYIADHVRLPIYLNGLLIESPIDPTDGLTGYTRPSEYLLSCGSQAIFERAADEEQQYVPLGLEGQATSLRLTVQRVHKPASGTRSGFSKVRAVLGAERVRTSRVRRLSGVVRDQGGTGDSTNYAFIEDDDHAPVGFTGVSAEAAGKVRVTYPECKRVVSFIAGCDEQMAALDYEVGASAGLSYTDINIRRHLAGIGCYLFSNGTTYQVGSVGNGITNVSYNSSTGVVTITHNDLGDDAIPVATPAVGSPAVQIGSLTPTTIQLRFVDTSGNVITGTPPATHQAYVFRQRPAATVTDVQNLAITQGNIWIMAELEY